MRGDKKLYDVLSNLGIGFDYYEHPPVPTVEEAAKYWKDLDATHCKNLFFRNHKGNRHYLVIIQHTKDLKINDLENRLKQGKLSFASEKRLNKFLGLSPGSVSPFGLLYDTDNHVHVFLDENLKNSSTISFHPNINSASIVLKYNDFIMFLDYCNNSYEYVKLSD